VLAAVFVSNLNLKYMSPQEKAKEIYNQYKSVLGYFGMMDVYFPQNEEAKKCALIAVNLRLDGHFSFTSIEYGEDSIEYWQLVKDEIECL